MRIYRDNPTQSCLLFGQPLVRTSFVFGPQDVRGGIHFAADGASVVYAAGCGVALFDSESRTQRLVPLADRDGFGFTQ